MTYNKPNRFCYNIARAVSFIVSKLIFKRKILRNEIRNVKGPFVVVANHETALDFVNLIGLCRRPMSFVISKSFFSSLPITGFMSKMGVIPKQQFQTSVSDLKKMKNVIDSGSPLVIYPAGLMCEDGVSTPIPSATYKFLKWIGADIYVARTSGTYFVMPKWAKGIRAGRTYMDVYKLFSKEEIANMPLLEVEEKTKEALLYDAYREQEKLGALYKNNDDIRGLENVLYMCPKCKSEFKMSIKESSVIACSECGYSQKSDKFGFLLAQGDNREIRYVSDWSREKYDSIKERVINGEETAISDQTEFKMVDNKKHRFVSVGCGTVTLDKNGFYIEGTVNGEQINKKISIANVPSLPFSPGKYFEIQDGADIYRCVLENGKLVMKFINILKIFFELDNEKRSS